MKKSFLLTVFVLFCSSLTAQQVISYNGSGNYMLRERSDFRRYDNGKYSGLVSKEVSAYITPVTYDNYYLYEGNFYINQKTLRDLYRVGNSLDDSIPSKFKIDKSGNLTMIEDYGFPTFRSFPSFSDKVLKPGDIWEAKATRAVDPLNKGIVTKMPIYVQYKYLREDVFNDEAVHVISAQWATRYGMGTGTYWIDFGGDAELQKASGVHKATIYVSKKTGNSLLIQDIVDETFQYTDGNQYQFKGTISLFTEYPPAVDRSKLIPALRRIADISDTQAEMLAKAYDETESNNFWNNNANNAEIALAASQKEDMLNKNDNLNKNNSAAEQSESNVEPESDLTFDNKNSAVSMTQKEQNSEKSDQLANKIRKLSSQNSVENTNSENTNKSNKKSNENTNKTSDVEKNKTAPLVTVDNTPAGIRLTIPDLQFQANSAELLPGEKQRLDKIAEVLAEIPDCKFLIEGHTAAVGLEKGEMQLSIERADSIASAFIARGIDKSRFICRGSGGTKPIATNETPEGRAKNRRVEITILE